MHNNSNDYDNISERFLLNGQILIDEFADSFAETALFGREDPYRLTGVRLFQKETLYPKIIFILRLPHRLQKNSVIMKTERFLLQDRQTITIFMKAVLYLW